MSRKPEWIHRVPHALQVVNRSSAPLFDRADIEELLDISPRQALRVLNQLGAAALGKNLVLSREQLISALERIAHGDTLRHERKRLQRLDRSFAELDRDMRARKIAIEARPETSNAGFPALPSTIRLRPGVLEIYFDTPEELLTRLFELSQAIANDFEAFEKRARRA